MTDKERLDAIKGRAMFNQLAKRTGEITHSLFTLDADDYDWLIEQAERVQELEEFKQAMEDRYKIWHIGAKKSLAEKERLEQQNNRYREALETIEMVTEFKSEANEIANKALEGDDDE